MAGFDPSQPRDEAGRWTATVAAARAGAGLKPISPECELRCTQFARKYTRAPVEHAEIIDPATGDVIYHGVGDEESVDLQDYLDGVNAGMFYPPQDAVLTHNHPLPCPHSANDIEFAAKHNMKEVRVAYWGSNGLEEHVIHFTPESRAAVLKAGILNVHGIYMENFYTIKNEEMTNARLAFTFMIPPELKEQIMTEAMEKTAEYFGFEYWINKK